MKVNYPDKPGCLWIECPSCGKIVSVASGFVAMEMPRNLIHQTLIKIGWQTVPKLRCDGCIGESVEL